VPVDAFWSITVYDAKGMLQKNDLNTYNVNSTTAVKNNERSICCDGKLPNCVPIMPGWNYIVRLHRPRADILDRSWTFPEAQPMS
jgi:hypothetical protein